MLREPGDHDTEQRQDGDCRDHGARLAGRDRFRAAAGPEVDRGITAMNGSPSNRAKYASETAVEPEDASITGVPPLIQPLQIA